ncbi:MAG: metalloprotease TldD [Burkholderiaceae bacterium]
MKIAENPALEAIESARKVLLEPFDLNESKILSALSTVFEHRVDFADLYFQFTRSEGWSLEEGIVKGGSFSIDQGVGVRAVSGEKTAFAYSDEISLDALQSAARATRTIARAGGGSKRLASKLKPASRHVLYGTQDPILGMGASAKVALLERVEKMARSKDPRVSQVMASINAEHDIILVARSDGLIAADVRPLVRLSISVIAEQNGRREQGYSGGGGRFELTDLNDELLERHASEAVRSALVNLDARPAPAGTVPVVLGPGWPGVLLHEAVGHGLEGDFNRKGSSVFSGKIGQRVASRGVTVVDDGTIEKRRGSLNIDDEGNATRRNVLIEDGILKGYLQDSLNARLMKTESTGSGRRESYAHLPMPRMTNTFMMGGKTEPGEIIESLDRGLYAVNFGGGQVDITNGKFVFSASEAYWVENGKIQYPVIGATLIGNGPESMNQVTMIGNDMSLDSGIGVCGKDGQSVPVGVGQPTLRIEGLTVGGTG